MSMVYLAEPIDQRLSSDLAGRTLARAARHVLSMAALSSYVPSAAFPGCVVTDGVAGVVSAINQTALANCSGLVAVVPPHTPTLGVPVEIETALRLGKPVLIMTTHDLATASVQVAEWRDRGAAVQPLDATENWSGLPLEMARKFASDVRFYDRMAPRRDEPGSTEYQFKLEPANYADQAAVLPSRGYTDDAGLDLAVIEHAEIEPGCRALLRTGVSGALPDDTTKWGLIVGRSSTWARQMLMVIPSVIDSGWRGELLVGMVNLGQETAIVRPGDRVAQIVVLPAWTGDVVQVDKLPQHERGLNGFGSTDGPAQ